MTRISHALNAALRLPLLGLAAAANLGLAACDVEEFDVTGEDLVLDTDGEVVVEVSADELDLSLGPGPETHSAPIININTYAGSRRVIDVQDGALILLENVEHGYFGCDGSDDPMAARVPTNTAGFVWKVHRVDLDQNGVDEIQLELLDGTTPTGDYLKMNKFGEVYCGPITGTGNGASWSYQSAWATGGTYKKVWTTLENLKQGLCLQVDGIADASGVACGYGFSKGFNIEAINP